MDKEQFEILLDRINDLEILVNRLLLRSREHQEILSVKQFCAKHKSIPEGGLRYYIRNKHENGLEEAGVLHYIGRKLLINEEKFFEWLKDNPHE